MELDKHYTNSDISKRLVKLVDQELYDIIVEPSAGDGSICEYIDHDKMIALDIMPDKPYIKKMDFFDFTINSDNKKILTIGNPPFGYRAQLAIEFFNHAAMFSDTIAFILPRSFRKAYLINQLNEYFHIDYDEGIDVGSFESGTDARCCIQIWQKSCIKRKKIALPKTCKDFSIVPQGKTFSLDNTNYAIRRTGYGEKVGELVKSDNATPITQFIFLNIPDDNIVNKVSKLNQILYKYSYETTAISPTFTIGEFIDLYERHKNEI